MSITFHSSVDGDSISVHDVRSGEYRVLRGPNDVVKVRVRDDGSWAFRRRFNDVRSVQKTWTRWQWKRGGSK